MGVKLSIFDIFGAIIPGIPLLILLSVMINKTNFSISKVVQQLEDLNLAMSLLAIAVSYLLGFSTQYLSYEAFRKLVRLWKKNTELDQPISFGERGREVSAIREHAPENYKVLNTFFAYRTMCYNTYFSLSLFGIILFIHQYIFFTITYETGMVCMFTITFSILFLRRAVSFHEWSHLLISDSMKTIDKTKKSVDS